MNKIQKDKRLEKAEGKVVEIIQAATKPMQPDEAAELTSQIIDTLETMVYAFMEQEKNDSATNDSVEQNQ